MVAEKTSHAKHLDVAVETTLNGTISTYQNKVSSSFPANVCMVMRNGQRGLASTDRANMYVNIRNSDRDKHNECCEQPCLEKDKGDKTKARVV